MSASSVFTLAATLCCIATAGLAAPPSAPPATTSPTITSPTITLAQAGDGEGLVVCGGHKTAPGEKKKGVMATYDKRTNTIAKALQAAGYQQVQAPMGHWSDAFAVLKIYPDKYAAFYDRNVTRHGPDLAFGDLGQRNKMGEVAKFCTLVQPLKVCEDFTAC